ncbi:MAG: hypothetical protein A3G23_10325 [Bacteroidetes bacterium RIFCSPLOWO2_12_FULL_37_12]|nr:MAG: hypothetical protein A3G23_10325 [Bacteroidetes bacterium RIFCSPLOWO2_12_FULL_37_12]
MRSEFFKLLLFLSALLFSCKTPEERKKEKIMKDLNMIYQQVQTGFTGYKDLEECCRTIGHRLTGSPNGKKAEEFVYQKLLNYGLQVRYEPFSVDAWNRNKVFLTYSDGKFVDTIPCVAHAFTPIVADVVAPIADVGNGLASDFDSVNVNGKIVLMNLYLGKNDSALKNLHRSEKATLALNHGAAGIIFINKPEGDVLLTGTVSLKGKVIDIPAVCISVEKGRLLRFHLKENVNLKTHIFMENTLEKATARNVIASIRGSKYPHQKIMIGAHLDSWDLATGAIDNGIGAFTVVDIARAIKNSGVTPEHTLEFALWMGEEFGLLGSTFHVSELNKNNSTDSTLYYYNLDMTGNPIGFELEGRLEMEEVFKRYSDFIRGHRPDFEGKITSDINLHSDHLPFALYGIPVLQFTGNLDKEVFKYYHSNKDLIDLVNADHLRKTSEIVSLTLYLLDQEDSLKAKRLTDTQVKESFEKGGLKEEMILSGDWKWEK